MVLRPTERKKSKSEATGLTQCDAVLGLDANDQAGNVIVLARIADEGTYISHNSFQSFGCTLGRRVLNARNKARFAVFCGRIIGRLYHSVGENE
jgi:hypothetical protein